MSRPNVAEIDEASRDAAAGAMIISRLQLQYRQALATVQPLRDAVTEKQTKLAHLQAVVATYAKNDKAQLALIKLNTMIAKAWTAKKVMAQFTTEQLIDLIWLYSKQGANAVPDILAALIGAHIGIWHVPALAWIFDELPYVGAAQAKLFDEVMFLETRCLVEVPASATPESLIVSVGEPARLLPSDYREQVTFYMSQLLRLDREKTKLTTQSKQLDERVTKQQKAVDEWHMVYSVHHRTYQEAKHACKQAILNAALMKDYVADLGEPAQYMAVNILSGRLHLDTGIDVRHAYQALMPSLEKQQCHDLHQLVVGVAAKHSERLSEKKAALQGKLLDAETFSVSGLSDECDLDMVPALDGNMRESADRAAASPKESVLGTSDHDSASAGGLSLGR